MNDTSLPASASSAAPAWDETRLADPHHQPDKADRVRRMFSAIAPSYDLNNRLHSLWRDQAWRRFAVRQASIQPGDVVVLTEDDGPLLEHEVYAVRTNDQGVVLALAMWNGAHLLLLPGAGRTDFLVFEARNQRELENRIAGRVATVIRRGS